MWISHKENYRFLEKAIILINKVIKIYEPKTFSFKQTTAGITTWKSSGIDNYSLKTDLRGVANISGDYPEAVSGGSRMSVKFLEIMSKKTNQYTLLDR